MNVLVIAPHPDDEVLGCGGTMSKLKALGHNISVLVLCDRHNQGELDLGTTTRLYDASRKIGQAYGLDYRFANYQDEALHLNEALISMREALDRVRPQVLFLPWPGDVHQDHRVAAHAGLIEARMMRGGLRTVLHYHACSSTDQAGPGSPPFVPNVFVDITHHLNSKLAMMETYGEMTPHPHPRSRESIIGQAHVWGGTICVREAEAFVCHRMSWP